MPQLTAISAERPTHQSGMPARPADLLRTRLPRDLVTGFRPHAGALARAVIGAVAREVDEYTEPMAGPAGPIMAATAQAIILRCLDAVSDARSCTEDWTALARGIGATECAAGRSLDGLQAAYRVIGRTLSEQAVVYVRRFGASTDLARLAAGVIGQGVRQFAATSTEGYAEARARGPRRSDRARQDLLRLIMSEHPADPDTIVTTARAAEWTVPPAVSVIALQPPHGPEVPPAEQLGESVLAGVDGDTPFLIVPVADARLTELCRKLPGWRAAVGPAVRIADVRASLRVARRALDLADRGLLPAEGTLDCADHHTVLTLFADDWLVDRLVERRLEPLEGLTDRQQERMLVTLHEWLITRGQVAEIGDRLGVHPQTVRYRLKKLEELFGEQLTEPESRFELALAVRAKLQRRAPEEEVAAAS